MEFNEWVSTIDNASSIFMAGMMLLQTIFIGAGFWLGNDYLKKHRQKVKQEKELTLIYDILNLMKKYRLLLNKAYGVPFLMGKKIDQAGDKANETILEWFCFLRDNYDKERELIVENEAIIYTNFQLIGRENLNKKWNDINMSFKHLEHIYVMMIHYAEFDKESDIVELFHTFPRSINSNKGGHLVRGNRIYRELVKEMIEFYKN